MSKLPHLPEVALSPVYSDPTFGKRSCHISQLRRESDTVIRSSSVLGKGKSL